MPNDDPTKDLRRYITIGCFLVFALFAVLFSVVFLSVYFPSSLGQHEIARESCTGDISVCEELFKIWQYSLNQRVFEWSLSSGKMIFWLSAMVTVSGLAFSFWQFWDASNVTSKSETGELRLTSEMLSVAFKFRSIGAMLLFISIVYLTIYAKFIYPIDMVEIWSSQSRSKLNKIVDVHKDSTGGGLEDPVPLPGE